MRLGVLASGDLGYRLLKHLLDNQQHQLVFVFTDKKAAPIYDLANTHQIPVFSGNPRKGRSNDFTKDKPIEVLLSINYIYLIESDLINLPDKIAVNVHGSLLPKYRGRTPHVWAIINNEDETGITAHEIDEGCDTGDILKQVRIPIAGNDTGAKILEKFNNHYPKLIDEVLEEIEKDNIVPQPQNHDLATYFNKRTPADGRINWNWQKERIRNWVRAQAYPYPGAFTYCRDEKLIVDEVQFDDWGFHQDIPNGLILTTEPLRVKCPNGVLRLTKLRSKPVQVAERLELK